jgi:hypothetical protein
MIVIKIRGPKEIIGDGLESYAREFGWTDTILQDAVPIPNPVSFLEFAKGVLASHFRGSILNYKNRNKSKEVQADADKQILEYRANVLAVLGLAELEVSEEVDDK